jgi:hypothetical protein
MQVTVDRIVSDQGTVVLFSGLDESQTLRVTFAVDHRPAQAIADALGAGEDSVCEVESWQIIGGDEA